MNPPPILQSQPELVSFHDLSKPNGSLTYEPDHAVSFAMSLMWVKTIRRVDGVHWWASNTPAGPAVTAFRAASGAVRADAWGPGSDWALSQIPALLGGNDDSTGFRPLTREVAALADRCPSVLIGATGRWYEALATTAIGQRVVRADAQASRTRLAKRFGTVFHGLPTAVFPTPDSILGIPDHDFHLAGVERSRARVVRVAAKHSDRLESLDTLTGADAIESLRRLPGVGPWTAGLTSSIAGGDPDAVPIGDLHLPRMVTHALCGEAGDDDRMLELLEPYRGHRMRIIRMVKFAGAGPPRHMPQPTRHDISRI